MRTPVQLSLAALFLLLAVLPAAAQFPTETNYQVMLTNDMDEPLGTTLKVTSACPLLCGNSLCCTRLVSCYTRECRSRQICSDLGANGKKEQEPYVAAKIPHSNRRFAHNQHGSFLRSREYRRGKTTLH